MANIILSLPLNKNSHCFEKFVAIVGYISCDCASLLKVQYGDVKWPFIASKNLLLEIKNAYTILRG